MDTTLILVIAVVLLACAAVALAVGVISLSKRKKNSLSKEDKEELSRLFGVNISVISDALSASQKASSEAQSLSISALKDSVSEQTKSLASHILDITKQLDERMQAISKMQEDKLETLRLSNEKHMRALQEDNAAQLDKMRQTVDEKLSKTINERFDQSFKLLSSQLESVYKSLDEMQKMGSEVGNLTKVLSNVKTTGIFGEVQLGAIFSQILTTEQYATNIVTGDGRDPVEFAVKFPGAGDETVYMPVDSKFPLSVYTDLQNAYDANDFEEVKAKKARLKRTICSMAKDIKEKYICPPKTTNFAVMFLPIEGLYAEIAKMGLIEELQEKYNVTIAGPTTMSALLSSFQMGFKTLAIQKKSSEVWKILGAVRTQFDKFSGLVEKIQEDFEKTSRNFDTLVGTRTRLLANKLRNVDALEEQESAKLLDLDEQD